MVLSNRDGLARKADNTSVTKVNGAFASVSMSPCVTVVGPIANDPAGCPPPGPFTWKTRVSMLSQYGFGGESVGLILSMYGLGWLTSASSVEAATA